MKKSIIKKLTITNVLIVILSLVAFCVITISIYTTYMKQSIYKQLVVENKIAYSMLIIDKMDDPGIYKLLSESKSLIYTKNSVTQEFEMTHGPKASFGEDLDIIKLMTYYIDQGKKVIEYTIDGDKYFLTMTTNKTPDNNADSVIVTLITTERIYNFINRFIIALIITAIILSVISMIISRIISKRITDPIMKVIQITKEYEKRNFENSYLADTQDEVAELSIAVNHMAKSIQAYDVEKEKLFRTISHEIKTPLTTIYGYAEGMKNGIFEDIEKPVTVIMQESMRIKAMTEDYIYLSKLESKIEIFKFEECDLTGVLEKAIFSIESMAILNDIDIDYEPIVIPKLVIDEDKIYRAFMNILSNCLKYTKDKIKIIVSTDESEVIIEISDNGTGLSDEAISNFSNGYTSEKSNGSGIGLFITREIIKKHKGEFIISNNSQGANFKIILTKN